MIELEAIKLVIIYGAITGGTYALLAVGFSLIYGVTEITNLAHGTLFMVGSYMYFFLVSAYGGIQLPPPLAFIISAIVTAILGSIIYRLAMDPVIEDPISIMVITISIANVLQGAIILMFGSHSRPIPTIWDGLLKQLGMSNQLILWGVRTEYTDVLSTVLSVALFALLFLFIGKTKIGRAMKALSQDREVAMLVGINTKRISMLAMAISSSFAAIAGVLILSTTGGKTTNPYIWTTPLFMSFAIVILGGLGSIKGALIGAFIIGYVNQIFLHVLDPILADLINVSKGDTLSTAVIMATMILILLFRPKGLFGKHVELED